MVTTSQIVEALERIPGTVVVTDTAGNARLLVPVPGVPDDERAVQVAIRPAQLLGRDALVVLADLGPQADLSLAVVTQANAKLGGAGVVLAHGRCALRLTVPLAGGVLEPHRLRAICEAMARRVDQLRVAATRIRPALLACYVD